MPTSPIMSTHHIFPHMRLSTPIQYSVTMATYMDYIGMATYKGFTKDQEEDKDSQGH